LYAVDHTDAVPDRLGVALWLHGQVNTESVGEKKTVGT
jgi:hypothetical protein